MLPVCPQLFPGIGSIERNAINHEAWYIVAVIPCDNKEFLRHLVDDEIGLSIPVVFGHRNALSYHFLQFGGTFRCSEAIEPAYEPIGEQHGHFPRHRFFQDAGSVNQVVAKGNAPN
jgi:hypothetical protein